MQTNSFPGTPSVARQTVDAVDAARMLGISERMLYQLTKTGQVPHKRVAGRLYYPIELLRQFVNDTKSEITSDQSVTS